MDLNLYLRVIRRFKYIVIVGVILAAMLAVLSYARVSSSGVTYRQPKLWASHVQLFVTQPGAPLFQATVPPGVQAPGNFATQAVLYASFAASPVVAELMLQHGKLPGVVEANAETTADGSTLPIIDLAGVATSPQAARLTAERGVAALRQYIVTAQDKAHVAADNRTILSALGPPELPLLIKSPSITRPIFIFLAVMIAVIGLAFVLENMRPRVRMQPPSSGNRVDARAAAASSAARHSGRLSG
jgi:hypothetical protein